MSIIMSILIPSLVFMIISLLLPGFKVTGSKLNYVWLTIGYAILMAVSKFFLVKPLVTVLGFIPLLGSLTAGIAGFLATFILSMIMLKVLDAFMTSFKMEGSFTALKASSLLAIASFVGNLSLL